MGELLSGLLLEGVDVGVDRVLGDIVLLFKVLVLHKAKNFCLKWMKSFKNLNKHSFSTKRRKTIITTFYKVIKILMFSTERSMVSAYRNFILFIWNISFRNH